MGTWTCVLPASVVIRRTLLPSVTYSIPFVTFHLPAVTTYTGYLCACLLTLHMSCLLYMRYLCTSYRLYVPLIPFIFLHLAHHPFGYHPLFSLTTPLISTTQPALRRPALHPLRVPAQVHGPRRFPWACGTSGGSGESGCAGRDGQAEECA